MSIEIGSKAPNFSLLDTERQLKSLNDFAGKNVVLAFFPGAFTGPCTKEMCALRDAMANFNNMNAQVIGVSVDSPFSNKAFADANKLNFPLLSDYTREVSQMYGGVYNDFANMKGYTAAKRAVFILNKNGEIKYSWVSDIPANDPPYDEIKKNIPSI
ncbi:MAG: peroxiredoxin [Bacteroidota bacterium]|nr:peroxiredoxin [Bacteroidota bacterium]